MHTDFRSILDTRAVLGVALGLVVLVTPAAAADTPAIDALITKTTDSCSKMMEQMAERPEIAEATKKEPLDAASACSCTAETLKKDAKLTALMQGDRAAVKARLGTSEARAYVALSTTQALFSCLAPILAKTSAAISLPE